MFANLRELRKRATQAALQKAASNPRPQPTATHQYPPKPTHRITMSSVITIKTSLNGVLRRISLDTATTTWSDVEARLRTLYGLTAEQQLSVSYVDEDGDRIVISTTEEGADSAQFASRGA